MRLEGDKSKRGSVCKEDKNGTGSAKAPRNVSPLASC